MRLSALPYQTTHLSRRALLLAGATWPLGTAASSVSPGRVLAFPRDFGAHPEARLEWWYATGWLSTDAARTPAFGFQLTFFRSRTDVPATHPSRFAASQLVFAHAAVTDLKGARLRHDQRIARAGFEIATATEGDTRVALRGWRLERSATATDPAAPSRYTAHLASDAAGFTLDLQLATTQPPLLQGEAGYSRKGPQPEQASHYYSQPQLAVSGALTLDGRVQQVRGSAWLDHEWSDSLLDPQAVGWDWIGMNLFDGSALTAFRLRRADGSTLYAGGSVRARGGTVRSFAPDEVRFTPERRWISAASRAAYPVQWRIATPAGSHTVKTLLDAQELDSRGSTGSIYWEGLSELLDASGQRVGLGYLEMTGYASPLRL